MNYSCQLNYSAYDKWRLSETPKYYPFHVINICRNYESNIHHFRDTKKQFPWKQLWKWDMCFYSTKDISLWMKFIRYIVTPSYFTEFASYFDGLVQDCSISIANARKILQSCTKPSIHITVLVWPMWLNIYLERWYCRLSWYDLSSVFGISDVGLRRQRSIIFNWSWHFIDTQILYLMKYRPHSVIIATTFLSIKGTVNTTSSIKCPMTHSNTMDERQMTQIEVEYEWKMNITFPVDLEKK